MSASTDALAMRSVATVELASPVTLSEEATLTDVAQAMVATRATAVLIHAHGGTAIVSESDLTAALAAGKRADTPAVTVATSDPITIDGDASVLDALALMLRSGVRNLPVIGRAGDVIGILTLREVMRAAAAAAGSVPWVSALRMALHIELGPASR